MGLGRKPERTSGQVWLEVQPGRVRLRARAFRSVSDTPCFLGHGSGEKKYMRYRGPPKSTPQMRFCSALLSGGGWFQELTGLPVREGCWLPPMVQPRQGALTGGGPWCCSSHAAQWTGEIVTKGR